MSRNDRGWIGVDFDGTLARHSPAKRTVSEYAPYELGEPVPIMLERVKEWVRQGKKVRIVTARVAPPYYGGTKREVIRAIHEWCAENGLPFLPVQAHKDQDMVALWDDRAIQVQVNTGRRRTEGWEPWPTGDA